jgi:hypothetical protein
MTVIAFSSLCRRPQYRVISSVKLMTTGTADFIVIMRAPVPGEPGICRMTSEAHIVLRRDACGRVGGEANNRGPLLSAPYPAGMHSTGTMAGFTLQLSLTEWAARISRRPMFCPEYGKDRLIAMTGEAGIRAAPAVRNVGIV